MPNGDAPLTLLVESERHTSKRLSDATDRISEVEGRLDGFVTYKDVLLKFAPIVIAAVAAGAGIAIAAANWT